MESLGIWAFGGLAIATIVANALFQSRFRASLALAPRLRAEPETTASLPTVSVIVPAYNEAINLRPCVKSVVKSELPDPARLQVIVADDESTDDTAAIAHALAAEDSRVLAFTVPPRPTEVPWQGKNWACANAVEKATGDYLLFIDADVRLEPEAIAIALADAQRTGADLLSCAPSIVCGCLAEWLVQPIVIAMIAVGFDFTPVNDPAQPDKAFAAGPFMLFRRSAYDHIGGHRAVATMALEDVTLARRIKAAGLQLRYVLAGDPVKVRMYQDFAALWEGWTKNFYLGANRQVGPTLFAALVAKLVFTLPWLLALAGLVWVAAAPALDSGIAAGLGGVALVQHLVFRLRMARLLHLAPRYWWLGSLGGLLVAAIAVVSIIKVETGWGWTWRGRSLANSPRE